VASFPTEQSLIAACVMAERVRPSEGADETKEEDDALVVLEKLDPDEYEPEVINILNALASEIKSQRNEIKTLKEEQGQFLTASQAASQAANEAEIEKWFDGQVNSLGDEFSPILGKGSYSSLDTNSSQFQKREEIAEQIAVLLAGYNSVGKEPPSRDELFQKAVRFVLADEIKKIEDGKLQSSLAKRSKQHINRSGKRSTKTGSEKPEDEVARMLDERYFKK